MSIVKSQICFFNRFYVQTLALSTTLFQDRTPCPSLITGLPWSIENTDDWRILSRLCDKTIAILDDWLRPAGRWMKQRQRAFHWSHTHIWVTHPPASPFPSDPPSRTTCLRHTYTCEHLAEYWAKRFDNGWELPRKFITGNACLG